MQSENRCTRALTIREPRAISSTLTRGGRDIWDTDFDESHICFSVGVVDQYLSHMLGPLPHCFRNINKKRCLCVEEQKR